jgi:hypothetical protein
MLRIFNFLKKKHQIFRKIRENFGNFQIIQKIIQNYSGVSLIGAANTPRVSEPPGEACVSEKPARLPKPSTGP